MVATEKTIKREREKGFDKELILVLPIIFLLTVFLFGIRAKIVPTWVGDTYWYADGDYAADLFGYFRMQMFVLVTVVFGLYLLFCIFTGSVKIQKHKVYIPMAIYTGMVLLSYAFSEYKDIALFGYLSRYEGTVTLLCYMAILFYTMHAVRSEKSIKLIIRCFGMVCLLLGTWGIFQVMGYDINDLPMWLYVPAEIREIATLNEIMVTNAVTWFFTNQNYSSFLMVFPICLFAMTCVAEEENKKKVVYAVLTGLMMYNLWQAASLGGMVGLAVSVVMAFMIAGVKNVMKWRKSLGLLVLAAVVSMGASLPVIMREVQSGTATLPGVEVAYATEVAEEISLQDVKIEYIITDGADIVFGFEGKEVRIVTENGVAKKIIDASGNEVDSDNDLLQVSSFVDEDAQLKVVKVKTAKKTWNFVEDDNNLYYVTNAGRAISLDRVESIGFENNQDFATYRGYIWSRTLPLVKETMLFGHGADTFAMYFPHDDYAGRYNINYFTDERNTIVDKPHNLYLGAAVQTGVISAIALIVIYAMYVLESIKIYRKREFDGFMDYIGMGTCIAVAGFMVSALVNDSTVQMMPVVYVFLGMGFAINRMVKNKKSE